MIQQSGLYHIDPSAKWKDGKPVTAFDVVATWDLIVHDDLKEPVWQSMFLKFKRPVALTKNIVMIQPKEPSWRAFFNISTEELFVMPEHIIGRIEPSNYMSDYNNKMMIGSGPYIFEQANPNEFIILKRDPSWWASTKPLNKNLFNFDRVRFLFYAEETVMGEKFKINAKKYAKPPDLRSARQLLHKIAKRPGFSTPRIVDKQLILYGAGGLGKMAKEYFNRLEIF